jgi:hypothetical protein
MKTACQSGHRYHQLIVTAIKALCMQCAQMQQEIRSIIHSGLSVNQTVCCTCNLLAKWAGGFKKGIRRLSSTTPSCPHAAISSSPLLSRTVQTRPACVNTTKASLDVGNRYLSQPLKESLSPR